MGQLKHAIGWDGKPIAFWLNELGLAQVMYRQDPFGQVDLEGSRAEKFHSCNDRNALNPCSSDLSHALKACSSSVGNHLRSVD
ncbi:unnamed protein product [Thlaspi arvense]|uniref:Uncharacterized protein n=1 Tax=Thlaspi arvense TaxID=13288 RepID=A0AAU9SUE9_THLAR|nr:unnamed protein product [Thlaspi arvense]